MKKGIIYKKYKRNQIEPDSFLELKRLFSKDEELDKFINRVEENLLITPTYLVSTINNELKKERQKCKSKERLYVYLNGKEAQFIYYFVKVSAAVVGSLFLVYLISNHTSVVTVNPQYITQEYVKNTPMEYEEEYKMKGGILTFLDKVNQKIIILTDNPEKKFSISK